jgi:hypothetical protein
MKNKIGIFHRRVVRHYPPFIEFRSTNIITMGYSEIEIYIGQHCFSIIYKSIFKN